MSRYFKSILLSVACVLGLATTLAMQDASASNDILNRVSCEVSGNAVIVDFGMSKHPTNFGITTPEDSFLYIVTPAKSIDHLGATYGAAVLRLSIEETTGTRVVDGVKTDRIVFSSPGSYKLLFQDANRAEFADLHAFSCQVEIPPSTAAISSITCTEDRLVSKRMIADESNTPLAARMDIGCQASAGCAGHGGCCTRALIGQPCYCNSCCIANPIGTATTRIASNDSP